MGFSEVIFYYSFNIRSHSRHCQSLYYQFHSELLAFSIQKHLVGIQLLNGNLEGTIFIITFLGVLCDQRYAFLFAMNRHLYSEYFIPLTCNFLLYVLARTSPSPESHALGCYMYTGKSILREKFETLDSLMERYSCLLCPTGLGQKMIWLCAGLSEVCDLHPGFLDFKTACDFVIMHLDCITETMEFIDSYTLPNGKEITNFIRTDNGLLADRLLQRPGTNVYVIPGLSQHSDLYKRENIGCWSEWTSLNTRYSGLRSMVFSTALILNPGQVNSLQQGKMSFDLDPKVISTWFVPFVNTWSSFVNRNPNVVITGLYVTDTGIYYGSPTDMEVSHLLMGYCGLPLILQHFRSVFTRLMSKIMGIGKQKPTDKAWVPLGRCFITM